VRGASLRQTQRFFPHRKEKRRCAAKGHAHAHTQAEEPHVRHETLDQCYKCGSGSIREIRGFFVGDCCIDEGASRLQRLPSGAAEMSWPSLPTAVALSGLALNGLALSGLAVSAVALSNGLILWSTRRLVFARLSDVPTAETAIVLGCAPEVNGRHNFYFDARMDAAAALFLGGKVKHLVVSGGPLGNGASECHAMVLALLQRGVPRARIDTHTAGNRTWESVKHSSELSTSGPFVFVSQAFHVPRAVWLARRLGVAAYGYHAASPKLSSVKHLRLHLREVASRTRAVVDVSVRRTKWSVPGV
jgi:SanA protein